MESCPGKGPPSTKPHSAGLTAAWLQSKTEPAQFHHKRAWEVQYMWMRNGTVQRSRKSPKWTWRKMLELTRETVTTDDGTTNWSHWSHWISFLSRLIPPRWWRIRLQARPVRQSSAHPRTGRAPGHQPLWDAPICQETLKGVAGWGGGQRRKIQLKKKLFRKVDAVWVFDLTGDIFKFCVLF